MPENISPQELLNRFQNNERIRIIDVRTPAEFGNLHVRNAENIPLDCLDTASLASNPGKDGFLYFICQSGGRSKKACDAMSTAGFNKIINIEGGTVACETAGLPVIRGRKAISLERQVRIFTGLLVFSGVLLASFGGTAEFKFAGLMPCRIHWGRSCFCRHHRHVRDGNDLQRCPGINLDLQEMYAKQYF